MEREINRQKQQELQTLFRELQTVYKQLSLNNPEPGVTNSGLKGITLFRNCPQFTLKDWEEFVKRIQSTKWIALPSNHIIGPALQSILDQIEHLSSISEQDPLTGLLNRKGLDRVLELELERSMRYHSPLSVAFLDLDNFKGINDRFGHDIGDEVLIAIANLLKTQVRKIDYVTRYGGEEFVIIVPGTGLRAAQLFLHRLLARIRELAVEVKTSSEIIHITCSIGLVCFKGRKAISAKEILKKADSTMYEAKDRGKDQLVAAKIIGLEAWDRDIQVSNREKQFLTGRSDEHK
ncbi:MAG: diguanylate cyclase [Nitrospiraceae bacterium]|nr:diguanylate cyclase [Nitrospiraceae bacterium]